jgi:hypothetical protein
MNTELHEDSQPLGLGLLSGIDSFINDLDPEDEASISGGRRGGNGLRRSRLRTLRSRRRSRRNNLLSLQRSRLSRLRSLRNPLD